MSAEFKYVGKRLPSISAPQKATGAAKFTSDIKLPGTLVAKVLMSARTHANIRSIDTSAAEALPGVEAVITYENTPKLVFNPSAQKWIGRLPIDHEDATAVSPKAHFIGDILGAVAAVDEETAIKAISLIKVDYEELPAVLTPFEALKEGAPLVHENAPNNTSLDYACISNRGDVPAALAESDIIVETDGYIHTSRQTVAALEPLTCTSFMNPGGELTIWTACQRPMAIRKQVAEIFGLKETKVVINCEYAGGFFGESNWPVIPSSVALALITKKPVRLEYTKEDCANVIPCREVMYIRGKYGFRKDGALLVAESDAITEIGGYHNRGGHTTFISLATVGGSYRVPTFSGKYKTVYTNTPATGGSRGYGSPQGCLVAEMLMDMAAERLGMDRLELRIKNMKHLGENAVQFPLETDTQETIMRLAAEKFGYEAKKSRPKQEGKIRHGIGMCSFFDVSGGQPLENMDRHCIMTLEEDGTVTITQSHPDGGMNLLGACAAIAAEVLGIGFDEINHVHASSKGALYEFGLAANSGAYVMGNMYKQAAEHLRDKIIEAAAEELDIDLDENELEIRDSAIWVKGEDNYLTTLKEFANTLLYNPNGPGRYLSVTEDYTPVFNPSAVGAIFVDVSVDTETGDIKIDKLTYVHDIGRAINPMTVEGQIQGGLSLGIGYALYEDMFLDPKTGAVRATNYNTYRVGSALDLPEMDIEIYEQPENSGPFGAKGVGMSGTIGVPAAVSTAIHDAVGVWLYEMPFTPERILEAIKKKG